jgi:hypothetical protein
MLDGLFENHGADRFSSFIIIYLRHDAMLVARFYPFHLDFASFEPSLC